MVFCSMHSDKCIIYDWLIDWLIVQGKGDMTTFWLLGRGDGKSDSFSTVTQKISDDAGNLPDVCD